MSGAVEKWEEAFGKKTKKSPKCWWAASVTNSLLREPLARKTEQPCHPHETAL